MDEFPGMQRGMVTAPMDALQLLLQLQQQQQLNTKTPAMAGGSSAAQAYGPRTSEQIEKMSWLQGRNYYRARNDRMVAGQLDEQDRQAAAIRQGNIESAPAMGQAARLQGLDPRQPGVAEAYGTMVAGGVTPEAALGQLGQNPEINPAVAKEQARDGRMDSIEEGTRLAQMQKAQQEAILGAQGRPDASSSALNELIAQDTMARLGAGRPVPNYGTETTMMNPYTGREMVAPLPGTERYNTAQDGVTRASSLISQLTTMQGQIKEMGPTGTEYFGGEARRFKTQYGMLATELGQLQELGVLVKSDIDLVLGGLTDVTSLGNNYMGAVVSPLNATMNAISELLGGDGDTLMRETSLAGYDEMSKFVENKLVDYVKKRPYIDIDPATLPVRVRAQLEY
jgi:hypothetical protein